MREIPATACEADRNPSDMFMVRDCPTTVVSADSRFINSPVFVLSKNEISWRIIEAKTVSRSRAIILLPIIKQFIFH